MEAMGVLREIIRGGIFQAAEDLHYSSTADVSQEMSIGRRFGIAPNHTHAAVLDIPFNGLQGFGHIDGEIISNGTVTIGVAPATDTVNVPIEVRFEFSESSSVTVTV